MEWVIDNGGHALAAAATLLIGALVLAVKIATRRRWERLHRELAQRDAMIAALQSDLAALCASATGVGERLLRVEQNQRRMGERQDQLELRDFGNRPYAQAIRLVHKGANVDELISNCGLSRGEAELVALMHSVDKAG